MTTLAARLKELHTQSMSFADPFCPEAEAVQKEVWALEHCYATWAADAVGQYNAGLISTWELSAQLVAIGERELQLNR